MGYAMESLSVSLAYCAIADPLSCVIIKRVEVRMRSGCGQNAVRLQSGHGSNVTLILLIYEPLQFGCGSGIIHKILCKLSGCGLSVRSVFRPFRDTSSRCLTVKQYG